MPAVNRTVPRTPARDYIVAYGAMLGIGALVALPLIWPDKFSQPLIDTLDIRAWVKWSMLALPPVAAWRALRGEPGSVRMRLFLALLATVAACFCENIHYWYVHKGHYFAPSMFENNTTWQQSMHAGIIRMQTGFTPHSYRFLSESMVALFHGLTGEFAFGRTVYRLLFEALLFVMLYRYARSYLSVVGAVFTMVVFAAIYPATILHYAGQPVDPASHLSILICLFCLARRYEPAFGPALFLGIYAKESVLVMAVCRAFETTPGWRKYALAALYGAVALGLALIIRIHLNVGGNAYRSISGVGFEHCWDNLQTWWRHWLPAYLLILGVLVPGAVLGWRLMDRAFRWTCLLLVVAMVISSIMFSWMTEVRNLVPAVFPLIVVNIRYLEELLRKNPTGLLAKPESPAA